MAEYNSKDEQDNERLALKSIYGDDMLELFPSSGKGDWFPFECIISLGPLHCNESTQNIQPVVCLHVTCSHEYPQKPPSIKLEQWKRVSNNNISRLQSELEELAQNLKGEVMIFQLAQHVKTFLHSCDKPGYKSFYDEMMMRQKKEQESERRIKEEKHKKKKEEILAEIQVKGQAVKKALRKRQNSIKSLEEEFDTLCHSSVPYERSCITGNFDQMDQDKTIKKKIDYNWFYCKKGQSRFEHEFEHLSSLGKGAFGHVIKVQNKLDDGLYAIKRIVLDPSEKQLNKKITREVKLLSRLNHENVVRYYNSWLESSDMISLQKGSSSEDFKNNDKTQNVADQALDMLPKNEQSLHWFNENSSTSDESSDDFIMFRSGSNVESDPIKNISKYDTISDDSSTKTSSTLHNEALIMYIQMELCDKSTLRLVIDDSLYLDVTRVWRLFREIVEGLCHIHQQGIIHRDLKPVNIFIGQDDHVKIGDFGLATTIILQKQTARESTISQKSTSSLSSHSSAQTDISQTGQVGTTLYVAPELNCIPVKLSYNQKVDIYSLGIIFFEMCTPPMITNMERYQILTDLRQQEPVFPYDYHLEDNSPQRNLMRSMLQYDADKRPSAHELLQNSAIPPPKREESEVSLMIKRTLSNPQSRNYKFLIASCFDQTVQPSLDATYNVSSWRSPLFTSSLEVVCNKLRNVFQTHGASSFLPPLLTPAGQALDSTVCLMTRFGSIVYATQDLQVPFARYLAQNHSISQMKRYAIDKVYKERPAGVHPKENYECAFDIITPTADDLLSEYEVICVIWEILKEFPSIQNRNCLIYLNHSSIIEVMLKVAGIDVTLFKNEQINIFKKTGFFHSKTDYEMYLKLLGISERSITSLIQWMNIEGPLNKVNQIVMSLIKDDQYITDIKFAFYQLETLSNFMQIVGITIGPEATILDATHSRLGGGHERTYRPSHKKFLRLGPVRPKLKWYKLVQSYKWLAEHRKRHAGVEKWAEGIKKCPVLINLGLVKNAYFYSGPMIQVVCTQKNKPKQNERSVILSGGRYDSLVQSFRESLSSGDGKVNQFVVGFTLSVDKLVFSIEDDEKKNIIDVLVCAMGRISVLPDKLTLLRDIWKSGLRSSFIYSVETLEEIQAHCKDMKIPVLILLKETDSGFARVRTLVKEHNRCILGLWTFFLTFPVHNIFEAILDQRSINKGCRTTAILQAQKGGDTDLKHLDPGNIDSRAKESQNHNFQEPCLNTELAKRYYEKKIYYPEILDFILKFRNSFLEASGSVKPELKSQASAEGPVISFMTHDKLTPLLKRRHESQILNNVQTLLPKFSSKVKVEILALSVDCDVLRSLSLYVDPNCNEPDINPILKRYPKHKKIIQRFQDHMDDVKNSVQVVTILYSLVDNTYQVLL